VPHASPASLLLSFRLRREAYWVVGILVGCKVMSQIRSHQVRLLTFATILHNLKAAFHNRKLKEGEDVPKDVNSLKAMREEYIRAGGKFDDEDFSDIILQSPPSSYESIVYSILGCTDKDLLDPDAIASILHTKSDCVSGSSNSSVAAKASYQGGQKRKPQNSGDWRKNNRKSFQSGKADTAKPPAKKKKMCICGTGTHNEVDCYHLHAEKPPESVMTMQKKLATEKNAKKVIMYSQSPRETAYVIISHAFRAKKLQGLPKDTWAFDFGASKHMCHESNAFITYTAFDEKHIVELGDAHCIPAHGIGLVNLICEVVGQLSLQLTEVLYVPVTGLLSPNAVGSGGCARKVERKILSIVMYQGFIYKFPNLNLHPLKPSRPSQPTSHRPNIFSSTDSKKQNDMKRKCPIRRASVSAPLALPFPYHIWPPGLRLTIRFQHPLRAGQVRLRFPRIVFPVPAFPFDVVSPSCPWILVWPMAHDSLDDMRRSRPTGAHPGWWGDIDPLIVCAVHLQTTHIDNVMDLHVIWKIQLDSVRVHHLHNCVWTQKSMYQLSAIWSYVCISDWQVLRV
jgi:hypothetical protein